MIKNWNFKFEIGARAAFVIGASAIAFAAVLVKEPGLAFYVVSLAAIIAL